MSEKSLNQTRIQTQTQTQKMNKSLMSVNSFQITRTFRCTGPVPRSKTQFLPALSVVDNRLAKFAHHSTSQIRECQKTRRNLVNPPSWKAFLLIIMRWITVILSPDLLKWDEEMPSASWTFTISASTFEICTISDRTSVCRPFFHFGLTCHHQLIYLYKFLISLKDFFIRFASHLQLFF